MMAIGFVGSGVDIATADSNPVVRGSGAMGGYPCNGQNGRFCPEYNQDGYKFAGSQTARRVGFEPIKECSMADRAQELRLGAQKRAMHGDKSSGNITQ
jgi:hypothetical protein